MRKIEKKIKISACWMVKNEEKNLPKSLESVKNQVDELIVIDTGSTDKTIEIAEKYGAKILETEWKNDFSTPRNMAIEQASGDWIIFLDADEFFENPKKIRNAIKKFSKEDAILIPRIDIDKNNLKELGRGWSLRIFRNVNYLRYRGLIHENVANISGEKLSYVYGNKDLTILHTGYSAAIIEKKLRRNLEIIEEEIKKLGRKPEHDIALVDCYAGLKEPEKVLECAKRALASEVQAVTGRSNLYHKIINAMRDLKYPDEQMLPYAEEAIKNFPNLPEFYAERGMILCGLNRLDEAYISFHKSLEVWRNMSDDLHEDSYFANAADKVYSRLSELEEFAGNLQEAKKNLAKAIQLAPQNENYKKRFAKL